MTVLIIIGSVLLGAILGRFFKVLVLLPAFALSLAIVVASSAYFGHSLSRTFIELVALVVSLQLGYVSGLLSSFIRNLRPGLEPSLYPDLDHLRQGDSLTAISLERRRSPKRVPIKRVPIKRAPTSGRKRPNFASLPCNRLPPRRPTTETKPVCTRVNSPRIISGSRLGGSRPAAKVNVTHSKTKRTVPQAAVRCDKRPGLRHCGLQRAGGCSRMR
jgi:hypothetical protein